MRRVLFLGFQLLGLRMWRFRVIEVSCFVVVCFLIFLFMNLSLAVESLNRWNSKKEEKVKKLERIQEILSFHEYE